MSFFRSLLGAIPSDTTRNVARWWDILDEHRDAWTAAQPVLAERGPLAALECFAEHTRGQVDDAIVAELRAFLVSALQTTDAVLNGLATAAVAMDGDAAKAMIDTARERVTAAGYQASRARHVVRGWLRGAAKDGGAEVDDGTAGPSVRGSARD